MNSVSTKITIIMLIVILLAITVTVGLVTYVSGSVIIDEAKDKIKYDTDSQALMIDEWLAEHKSTISATAAIVSRIDDLSENGLKDIFNGLLSQNTVYQDVYMGFPDNTAILGSGFPIENEYSWWKATERDWYKLAMSNTNVPCVTPPYIDTATGSLCISISQAVKRDGVVLGVVGADILINELRDIVLTTVNSSTDYTMLLNSDGAIIIHPDEAYKVSSNGDFQNLASIRNGTYTELWRLVSRSDGVYEYRNNLNVKNYYTASTVKATDWHLVSVLPTNVVTKQITNVILFIIPISLGVMLLTIVIIFMTVRNLISLPLTPAIAFFNKAATTGDINLTQVDIDIISKFAAKKDEIGKLIAAAALFVKRITDVSNTLELVAGGDLSADLPPLSTTDTLGKSLQKMTDGINNLLVEINDSTHQFNDNSRQIADRSQALAQGATEQAASIQQLSSSIADIADKTRKNADMAGKAATLSDTIKNNAVRGSKQMDDMIDAVNQINESSGSIGKVIRVIDDIAFQTNILALNAAVEAARAGQHGKGFAVVAEEVRNLAAKSAEAAKDTGAMIENSIEKANLGVRIAGETAESLTEIVSGINESSQIVGSIANSSEEQSAGIEQINIGIDQVAMVIQNNSASAQEEAAASQEMSSQASILQDLIMRFKLKGGGAKLSLPPVPEKKRNGIVMPGNAEYAPAVGGNGSMDAYGKY